MSVIGDVKDKNVIMVDDMIDTAGTICNAAQAMHEKGAKRILHAVHIRYFPDRPLNVFKISH